MVKSLEPSEAITEPSAVAPDVGIYFNHFRHTKERLLLKLILVFGATALGSVG